jgi:hypothetical protein
MKIINSAIVVLAACTINASSTCHSQVLRTEGDKIVYGIMIGAKSTTYSSTDPKGVQNDTDIPGVVRIGVDWDKLMLPKPLPCKKYPNTNGWMLVSEKDGTVVGAGISSQHNFESVGKEMRTALFLKCENVSESPLSKKQGSEPYGRDREREAEGITSDGLIMRFTDRQIGNSVVNEFRLYYIDPKLAKAAARSSVQDSGF